MNGCNVSNGKILLDITVLEIVLWLKKASRPIRGDRQNGKTFVEKPTKMFVNRSSTFSIISFIFARPSTRSALKIRR
jgi:hypothetical protein